MRCFGDDLDCDQRIGPRRRIRPLDSKRRLALLHRRSERQQVLPLDQINASNFNKLEVAWRFKTDNLGPRPEYKLEGTPLVVNGVLYTTGGTRRSVVALDAKTGELIWVYSFREGNRAAIAPRQLSGRGVSYWTDGKGDDRIIFVTTGYRLVELNANTGADHELRQGRHGRSESRHGHRHRRSRSIWKPAKPASTPRRSW